MISLNGGSYDPYLTVYTSNKVHLFLLKFPSIQALSTNHDPRWSSETKTNFHSFYIVWYSDTSHAQCLGYNATDMGYTVQNVP